MTGSGRRGLLGEAVLLAAGVAGAVAEGVGEVLAKGRAVLGRSDVGELAGQGHQEIRARGQVLLDRFAVPPAYLEVVARQVVARAGRADG
ncbi:polyprenyl synthetase [Kitasatospora sp. NPDC006697]|uniref:polyprenyl synthetase n=1 Tax=Kitasatospora sp. NPDC006697 TaxID=3364020 RepID=UPI0036CEA46A